MSSDPVEIPDTPQSPSPTHIHVLSISSPSETCSTATVSVNLKAQSPLLITPPKLTRCPTLALTQIDAVKPQNITPSPLQSEVPLPPPPPLIKMPISTRKEKRGAATKSSAESEEDKPQEPPRKRTRTGNSESESAPPARKIIQEIFGPDKSKKPKGRKKRRGVTTPKKKSPVKQERQEDVEYFEVKQEDEQNEHELENEFEENKNDDEDEVEKQQDQVHQVKENQEEEVEENVHIKEEQIEDSVNMDSQHDEDENEVEVVADNQAQVEDVSDDDDASKDEVDSDSATSISRVRIGRNAKRVANEKLKKISQQNETGRSVSVEPETVVKEEEEDDDDEDEEEKAGEIQSRRSTTEGSSKSSGSIAQAESESSSKHFYMDPQINNSPTPMSVMSEDDDQDMKEDLGETVSVSDLLDQKDSDVDSTYSWKPVRAAAAFALEQVTKKQGGSVVLGEGETKTGAAAERRARKIQRYKGRNRRTLLFKSSSSKQYTSSTVRKRWSAQPTIIPKIFHHGNYFQAGDVVFVEMEGDNLLHGQVSGILMDQCGEISAGIRWLAPVCPIYSLVDFDPNNYGIRYDVPEKLVKIEYLNFVMHLNPDYFQGHSSFRKIEKNSIYSRFGRSIHTFESDSDSSSDNEKGSRNRDADSSSTSENGSKSASVKINKEEEDDDESDASEIQTKDRKRQYSGSSSEITDVDDDDDEETKVSKNEEYSKEDVPGQHEETKQEENCPEKRQAIDMDVDELNDNSEIDSKEVESVESDNDV